MLEETEGGEERGDSMTTIEIDSIKDISIDTIKGFWNTHIDFKHKDGHITTLVLPKTDAAYLTEKLLEIFPVGKEAKE